MMSFVLLQRSMGARKRKQRCLPRVDLSEFVPGSDGQDLLFYWTGELGNKEKRREREERGLNGEKQMGPKSRKEPPRKQ